MDERLIANRANWEDRVPIHLGPNGYDLGAFDDPAHISRILAFDRPLLGDINGLDVVHLQCHIGTDTVSLSRLGARSVVGFDFSPAAPAAARDLAARAQSNATFIEGELSDAVSILGAQRCDLVYTGIGALNWLPDIDEWARVVAGLLRPGGRLHLRDAHPQLLALDDERADELLILRYPAFGRAGATKYEYEGTYRGNGQRVEHATTYEWNWGLGEIVTALLDAGLQLDGLTEHTSVPWNALEAVMHAETPTGEYELVNEPQRLACTFTLRASKPTT